MNINSPTTILIPLPTYGCDPTEVAVPWKYFTAANYKVVFATPKGKQAAADIRLLTGKNLGIFKKILMADANAITAYQALAKSAEFQQPIHYQQIRPADFVGIFLPGGHDQGMREYLESTILQNIIVDFFEKDKPVGAICHGTLLVGRSISTKTGKSVLWGRKTTGLTRPQELIAYYLTRFYLGNYYRTYPRIMEDELKSYLKSPDDFTRGPEFIIPLKRDHSNNLAAGFVIKDGNYLSARWPGDAHKFAEEFVQMLKLLIHN